jgi:hypothetical protein
MEAGKNSVIYMGLILGPNKADDTCGRTTVTGTMDRGFTVLANEQCGFKNSSSTEKASFKLINGILLALNKKLTVGGIFCDLGKSVRLCEP